MAKQIYDTMLVKHKATPSKGDSTDYASALVEYAGKKNGLKGTSEQFRKACLALIFEVLPEGSVNIRAILSENSDIQEQHKDDADILNHLIDVYSNGKINHKSDNEIKQSLTEAYQQYELRKGLNYMPSSKIASNQKKEKAINNLLTHLRDLGLFTLFAAEYPDEAAFQETVGKKLRKIVFQHLLEGKHGPLGPVAKEYLAELEILRTANGIGLSDHQKWHDLINQSHDGVEANYTDLAVASELLGVNLGIISHSLNGNNRSAPNLVTRHEYPNQKYDIIIGNEGGGHYSPLIDDFYRWSFGGRLNCGYNALAAALDSYLVEINKASATRHKKRAPDSTDTRDKTPVEVLDRLAEKTSVSSNHLPEIPPSNANDASINRTSQQMTPNNNSDIRSNSVSQKKPGSGSVVSHNNNNYSSNSVNYSSLNQLFKPSPDAVIHKLEKGEKIDKTELEKIASDIKSNADTHKAIVDRQRQEAKKFKPRVADTRSEAEKKKEEEIVRKRYAKGLTAEEQADADLALILAAEEERSCYRPR